MLMLSNCCSLQQSPAMFCRFLCDKAERAHLVLALMTKVHLALEKLFSEMCSFSLLCDPSLAVVLQLRNNLL